MKYHFLAIFFHLFLSEFKNRTKNIDENIKSIDVPNTVFIPTVFIKAAPINGAVAPLIPPKTVAAAIYLGVSCGDAILVITTYPISSIAAKIKPAMPCAIDRKKILYVKR